VILSVTRARCALVAACLSASCGRDWNLISVEQEIEIGRALDQELREQLPELADRAVSDYVQSLGRRLAGATGSSAYPYSFAVANYREINAFALPGGAVWINRGVLRAATNESQVAGVLAHEIAHIDRRHAARRLTQATLTSWGLGLLGAVLGNSGGASAAQTAAGLLADGVFLKFSRDDEREADRVGLRMLRQAGWDGRGMPDMFEIIRAEAARDPSQVEVFFSSHPPPADRIGELKREGADRAGGTRDTPAFREIKARLARLAPGQSMAHP
jgi:predicted Zn-dependent protease